jgi:hypothetical protein
METPVHQKDIDIGLPAQAPREHLAQAPNGVSFKANNKKK